MSQAVQKGPVIIPIDYKPALSTRETMLAIRKVEETFERNLMKELNLTRVPAPLFVESQTGINDNLNGVEIPVSFTSKDVKKNGAPHEPAQIEIVHSLAKWKRMALKKYHFKKGEGIVTDMTAIRKDEELSNIHSLHIEQWDWEKIIDKNERNKDYLKNIVRKLFSAFKQTEDVIAKEYSFQKILPQEIFFLTTQELEDRYPDLPAKDREHAICKEKGAVFLMEIGKKLKSGKVHDPRAPDYDDWDLNGDILFWCPILNRSVELSSMGIRVDKNSLEKQLLETGFEERKQFDFHQAILKEELPFTVGGGIGKARTFLYFLRKAHLGEVQVSTWNEETKRICQEHGIELL
ncbi:hypothetical protein ABK040_009320 [Willaertia magna]